MSVFITSTGASSNQFSYTVSNVTTTVLLDASDSSLDQIANVLGSVINSIKALTGEFSLSGYIAINVTTSHSLDASDGSLDEDDLANFLGSLITTLQNGSLDTYTVTNATYRHSYDATVTSMDEIANVMASLVLSLKGAGVIQ